MNAIVYKVVLYKSIIIVTTFYVLLKLGELQQPITCVTLM